MSDSPGETHPRTLHLKVLLPTRVLVDAAAAKVVAEAENGSFCLLPRHIDFATALVPGILAFTAPEGRERYLAVDIGTLVKCGDEVLVSAMDAVEGTELAALRETVEERFMQLDEHDRLTRSALARLEAGTIRRFTRLEERG
ncbi:MAG: F0F1 ATP synthase subunit epsilon [Chromatiales bacterium]|jgi:F-type H+-transporting ATPase subunit epsilon